MSASQLLKIFAAGFHLTASSAERRAFHVAERVRLRVPLADGNSALVSVPISPYADRESGQPAEPCHTMPGHAMRCHAIRSHHPAQRHHISHQR